MAILNAVGNALTGSTGSGTFVGSTSPTLVTPTLGVASATSINFGGSALSYYTEGTFTPVASFLTPGDLSVSYSRQLGYYTRTGRQVDVTGSLLFTPTYSTATGTFRIEGFPFASASLSGGIHMGVSSNNVNITYPAGATNILLSLAGTVQYAGLFAVGSGFSSALLTTAEIVSGSSKIINFQITYFI